jgi:hypothetical protein
MQQIDEDPSTLNGGRQPEASRAGAQVKMTARRG